MKNVLKIETILLQAMFAVCASVCLLVMGSMLTAKSPVVAANHAPAAVVASTNS
jgi:hypothetical protein